jgi:hypothetical protein
VPDTVAELPEDPELEPLEPPDDAGGLLVVVVVVAAVWTVGVCGWNASTPAVPATVAVRTMGDWRIGLLGLRR